VIFTKRLLLPFFIFPHAIIGLAGDVPPPAYVRSVEVEKISTLFAEHIGKNKDLLDIGKRREVVILVGNTGSGKTTLSNLLSNVPLIPGPNGTIVLEDSSHPQAMEIGGGGTSVTVLPRAFLLDNHVFFDMPGLQDTRGTPQALLVAAFIKQILEQAASARILFVVSRDEILAARGALLKDFLQSIQQLIPGVDIFPMSALLITKARFGLGDIGLIEASVEPGLLDKWEDRIAIMSEPKTDEVLPEADDILKRVLAAQSIPIANVSVDSLYTAAESQHLQGLCEHAMFLVSDRLFDQALQGDLSQVSDVELDTKITLLQQISSSFLVSIQEDSLLELLRPLSTAQYDAALLTISEQMNEKSLKHQAQIQAEIESRRAREAERQRQIAAQEAQAAAQRAQEAERQRQAAVEQARIDNPVNWPRRVENRVNKVETQGETRRGPRDVSKKIGSGFSRRTAWGWRFYTDIFETQVTEQRTVSTGPAGQLVIVADWHETARSAPVVIRTNEHHEW